MNIAKLFLIIFVTTIVMGAEAWGGTGGYFVTYNSNIEKGEIELMFMTDITAPSRFKREEGQGNYLSHMLELEYAPLHQFATEFMIEWFEDMETGDAKFTGFRWENRFRLFKKNVPLNPMIYVEYEDLDPATRYKMEVSGWINPPYEESGEEPDRERILESRLILSQDFGPVNIAFNWINETELETGHTAFGYSLGTMWMIHKKHEHSHGEENHKSKEKEEHEGGMGLGLEFYGALGDSKSFGLKPSRQEHYVGPIFMYHIDEHWMFHTQLAIGLSKASDNLARINFAYEF
ncbi:MAG: hypothetical protein HYU97_12035 [Deltaproteobacteria bacterium]|nr:hypothetical protein [Deltaproteobacteria bacterium]